MRDNLEHGWLMSKEDEYHGEIVGYCEDCCKPIYEDENFVKIDGVILCQDCNERFMEMQERELEEDYD